MTVATDLYACCTVEPFEAYCRDITDEQYFATYAKFITAHKIKKYSSDPVGFFGTVESGGSDALIFGSACHKMILEGVDAFSEEFSVYHGKDAYTASGRFIGRKSKKWKAICDNLGRPHDKVINSKELETLRAMHIAFCKDHEAVEAVQGCLIETAVFWYMHGMAWQGKMDALCPHAGRIVDLKTTADVYLVDYAIQQYGYDLQAAVYCAAYKALYGSDPDYKFIFIEKKEPYRTKIVDFNQLDIWAASENVQYWAERLRQDVIARNGGR